MEGNNNSFHLEPMSDEDIEKMGLSLSDVWMLKTPSGQSVGPFSTEMLKDDSKAHPAFYEECEIYNLVTEEWKVFYKVTEFQRRRPKLIPAQNLIKNETFLVLSAGQKSGPFTLEELQAQIDSKQVSLNQEISVDEGKSWIKIYEHHAFDRRARVGQEDLPFQPSVEVFEHADEYTNAKVISLAKDKEDDRVISGLAFIGRGNDRGQRITFHKASEPKEEPKQEISEVPSAKPAFTEKFAEFFSEKAKIKMAAAAAVVCLMIGGFTFSGSFGEKESTVGEANSQDAKRINNSDRSINKRKPASFHRPDVKRAAPTRAKRYVAPERNNADNRRFDRRQRSRKDRISHKYEDFESLDIDDPKVRAELTRELAGDYYDEQNQGYDDNDAQGEYRDDYRDEAGDDGYYDDEAPRQGNKRAYESEGAPGDEYRDEPPQEVPRDTEEVPYEEYGDFE